MVPAGKMGKTLLRKDGEGDTLEWLLQRTGLALADSYLRYDVSEQGYGVGTSMPAVSSVTNLTINLSESNR